MLSKEKIIEELKNLGITPPKIIFYESIDSTNTRAKEWAKQNPDNHSPVVFIANRQTAGRGRRGRSFVSEGGAGIYISILTYPEESGADATATTARAAVTLAKATESLSDCDIKIKWVNDLYRQGKKVCGILCESVCLGEERSVVVGIGINVRSAEFPPELSTIAGSLCADKISLAELVAAVCGEIFAFLENPTSPHWLEEYRRHSTVLGKEVRWIENGIAREGIAESICEDGALCVRDENGAQSILRTGEISLRLMQ